MGLNVIKDYKEIEDIKNTLKDRKAALVIVNNKYFKLLPENTIIKSGSTDYTTEFEEMKSYDGNLNLTNGYWWDPVEYPLDMWQSYNVDFYGVNINFVSQIKSEIIISGGPSNVTSGDEFIIYGDYTDAIPGGPDPIYGTYSYSTITRRPAYTYSEMYTQYKEDDSHITLTKSVSIRHDKYLQYVGAYHESNWITVYADYPLQVMYSKLILCISNFMELS